MGGLSSWSPYHKHVQGGLRESDFINGQFILLAAGPPHMANFGGPGGLTQQVVYPIGVTQNLAMSQNRVVSRIFEVGSERSYFIPGRTVGQLTLARVEQGKAFRDRDLIEEMYGDAEERRIGTALEGLST